MRHERAVFCLILVLAVIPGPARGAEPVPTNGPPPAPRDGSVGRVQAPGLPAAPTPAATAPAGSPAPGTSGPALARAARRRAAPTAAERSRTAERAFNYSFIMLGDQLPVSVRQFPTGPPPPPNPRQASALVPSVRGFKIAENQSPQPQDRFFYSFNFFANANAAVNQRFDTPITNLRVYRHIFGVEKTIRDGRGSFGLRLPVNTLTVDNRLAGRFRQFAGTSTAPGDLSLFAKYVLEEDRARGNLLSVGLVITPPTGPDVFAESPAFRGVLPRTDSTAPVESRAFRPLHSTSLQPFLGYIWNYRAFYLHGFSALDVPVDNRDVTTLSNDVGLGYYLYRNPDPSGLLTAVAPTFEVHVTTPLNHRDVFNANDPGGTANVVNLTYGVNFGFSRNALLTFGFVTPVTGPKPFDYEALLLFNLRFGGSRGARRAAPPVLGG